MKSIIVLKTLTLSVFFLTFAFCCKKDQLAINLEGKWMGQLVTNGFIVYNGFNIKSDHSLEGYEVNVDGENIIASGTWTLRGNIIDIKYSYIGNPGVFYLFTGQVNVNSNQMMGTFGEEPSKTDNGTWEMTKQ